MFYYMIGKNNRINFAAYDCFMRSVEIDSNMIEECQNKHPDEYKVYKQFKKKIVDG